MTDKKTINLRDAASGSAFFIPEAGKMAKIVTRDSFDAIELREFTNDEGKTYERPVLNVTVDIDGKDEDREMSVPMRLLADMRAQLQDEDESLNGFHGAVWKIGKEGSGIKGTRWTVRLVKVGKA